MKIAKIAATVINIPYEVPFVSSFEVRKGTTRTLVRLETDEGLVGYGETFMGASTKALVDRLAPQVIGMEISAMEALHKKFHMTPFFYGYVGYSAVAGIEMACWDALGKKLNVPLYELLGGKERGRIPLTGIPISEDPDAPPGSDAYTESVVRTSKAQVEQYGFGTLKIKGSKDWRYDVKLLHRLAAEHDAETSLRIDPNGAWTVEDSIRLAKRVEDVESLQWLEDPTEGIEGMARVKHETSIPLATNMYVVAFEHIAPAFRANAVDVVLADCHKWGGIVPTKKLAGACEALHWGMGMHSGGEAGISTAAYLHIATSTPVLRYSVDTLYWLYKTDIIEQPFIIEDGSMAVPDGPGLGVEVDEDKVAELAELNRREGDLH